MTDINSIPRRRFLGGLALAGAALAAPHSQLIAEAGRDDFGIATSPEDWDHSWLAKLNAKHKPFFENKTMGSDALAYPKRYYDAMLDGYGAAPKDIQVVIGFAGSGWPIAITDEKWAAWGLSASPNGGNPPGRNPSRGDASGEEPNGATIMGWKKRGAILLVCNNSLKKGAADLAVKLPDSDATKIYADIRASIIPEFIVVPALVAALAMAQEQHCAYLVGS